MEAWVQTLIGGLVSLLINALFIHIAASTLVKGKQTYVQAILAAFLASLAASLVLGLLVGTLGQILAILAWIIVVGAIYRTGLIKALLIGLGAGVVSWLINLILGLIF